MESIHIQISLPSGNGKVSSILLTNFFGEVNNQIIIFFVSSRQIADLKSLLQLNYTVRFWDLKQKMGDLKLVTLVTSPKKLVSRMHSAPKLVLL